MVCIAQMAPSLNLTEAIRGSRGKPEPVIVRTSPPWLLILAGLTVETTRSMATAVRPLSTGIRPEPVRTSTLMLPALGFSAKVH